MVLLETGNLLGATENVLETGNFQGATENVHLKKGSKGLRRKRSKKKCLNQEF